MIRLALDPAAPNPSLLAQAAAVVSAGGVVAYPTDTLYGLAVDPRRAAAVDALFRIKGREAGQPLPLIAACADQVERSVGRLPELGRVLANRFWPGPLTLVIEASPELAARLHSLDGRVAVRVPAHPIAQALADLVGYAVTSTSANRSGQTAPGAPDEVVTALGEAVDLLLDGGPAPGGPPSTIVDVTGPAPLLIRAGVVAWERVLESLHRI
jgi:L-threonylcarbamoyladenylate synthase